MEKSYRQLKRELEAIIPVLQHRLECINAGEELTYHDVKTTASLSQQLTTYAIEFYTELKLKQQGDDYEF